LYIRVPEYLLLPLGWKYGVVGARRWVARDITSMYRMLLMGEPHNFFGESAVVVSNESDHESVCR